MRVNIFTQMQVQHFSLREATVGIAGGVLGKKVALTIPAGAEVAVEVPLPLTPETDVRTTITVRYKGESVTMFLVDFQTRAQRVAAAKA